MAYYHVDYWIIRPKTKKTQVGAVCFAQLNSSAYDDVTRVQYMAAVDKSLHARHDAIDYWLDFFGVMVNPKHWNMKYLDKTNQIFYTLDCKGMKHWMRLFYLTAFRYVDEYPDIILYFHDTTKDIKDNEEKFNVWQQMHVDQYNGKLPKKYVRKWLACGGHSFISPYYFSKPITLDNLKARLKTETTVNDMFQ